MPTHYDRLSRWYDLLADASERRPRAVGLSLLSAGAGEIALEIGCGTGHGVISLSRSVGVSGHVFGLDLSSGMLSAARERLRRSGLVGRIDLIQGDALTLPFRGGSFDIVFLSFTLELFENKQICEVLNECRRVLRVGGRIAVVGLSSENRPNLVRRLYEWAHRRFPDWIDCRPIPVQREIEGAGFQVVDGTVVSMWGLPVEIVTAEKPATRVDR